MSDRPVKEAMAALRDAGLAGRSRERDRLPTADELARLRVELKRRSSLPLADMLDFARITAMRREEVCRLRWADLDAAAGTILIRDRKDPRKKLGNHQRVPLLFGSLQIALRQPRTGERIFPVKAETISTVFPRACRACGIADLRWHDLRHAGVTMMFAAGMPIEEVALVSGHRSWEMLRRYTHPSAAAVADRYRDAPEPPATPPGSSDGREPDCPP